MCRHAFLSPNQNDTVVTAVSRCGICLLSRYLKGEPNHWKSDVLCVLLGFGLGLEEKSSILKLFTFWI